MTTGWGSTDNGSLCSQAMAGFFARSQSVASDNAARQELVSRSRILYMESPIARSCIDVLLRECVGAGLRYTPKDSSAYFENYEVISGILADDLRKASDLHLLEASHRLTFPQIQALVFRTILLSGDCFLIRQSDGTFSIYEPDYFFTPPFLTLDMTHTARTETGNKVMDGVEIDDFGTPVAYWMCRNLYGEEARKLEDSWVRIPAVDGATGMPMVLHCAYFDRPQQYRGLPLIAPVIADLWSLRAYLTSETQMAILQCNQSWVVTTNTNPTISPFVGLSMKDLDAPLVPDTPKGDKEASKDFSIAPQVDSNFSVAPMETSLFNGALRKTNFIQPGSSIHLAEGESIQAIQPTAPHSGLKTFLECVIDQIGAAVGIPAQILTAHIDSNYSSAKASFAQLQHTVRHYRAAFVETFLKPFFECFAYDESTANGWTSDKYTNGEAAALLATESVWLPSSAATILEPQRELEFYKGALELGLISRDEVANLLFGHDARADVAAANE